MIRADQDAACPLCNKTGLEASFVIRSHRFFKCQNCRLIQMSPVPRVGVADDYTGLDLDRYRKYVRLFLVPRYRRALSLISKYKRSGRPLDIGCGTGEFLDQAREAGFEVTGLDPSKTACQVAGERHDVICGKFEDASVPVNAFDVITLWSVLEHVPRPLVFLEKTRMVGKEDAFIALRLPAADGLLPLLAHLLYRISMGEIDRPLRVIYQLDWHYKHYYSYNAQNTARLLRKMGWEPLCVLRESSYDIPSLEERMDYLPSDPFLRLGFKAALTLIQAMSRILDRQDELVVIARRASLG